MSDLRELYQEMILDHGRTPRNFKVLEGANREAEGFNPLCGDQVTLYLKYENDVVEDAVRFVGAYRDKLSVEDSPKKRDIGAWSALARVLLTSNGFLYVD